MTGAVVQSPVFKYWVGEEGHDTVFAEYCGEGTIAPLMMIRRRGDWKYITTPADRDQLYHLPTNTLELTNLARAVESSGNAGHIIDQDVVNVLAAFRAEALKKWDFKQITQDVLKSQRQRRFAWGALKIGKFTSWDYNPVDDGREKYIRSHLPLDELELKARFPAVDALGHENL